ncbi:MAG: hypothetical protein AAGB11_12020 [Pseudomonadota bacterium]
MPINFPTARLQGGLLFTITLCVIFEEWSGSTSLALIKQPCVVALIALFTPEVTRSRLAFVIFAASLTLLVPAFAVDWLKSIKDGLDTGAFIAAFFSALTILKTVAERSPAVRRAGEYLASQRPGRRYIALTLGSQGFALLLNYAALQLLGALSSASARRESDPTIRRIRIRRMLLAIDRGLISTLPWSPTSFAIAITTTVIPSTSWSDVAGPSLVTAVILAGTGWGLDTLFKPKVARPPGRIPEPVDGIGALAPLWILLIILIASVAVLYASTSIKVSALVMVIVPMIAVCWMAAQADRGGRIAGLGIQIREYLFSELPGFRSELVLLILAGYIGTVGAEVLTPVFAAREFNLAAVPAGIILVGFVLGIPLFGQLGMNPIMAVTLFAPLIPPAAELGVSPTSIVLAITAGWALSGATSPFTATTLLVSRFASVSAWHVGLRWNGLYALACAVLLSFWVLIYTYVL